MTPRRALAAWLAGGLVLGACSGGDPVAEPDPLVDSISDRAAEQQADTSQDAEDVVVDEPEPEPEPEPVEEDPFAVPDEINEAYAELVMNELLHLQHKALSLALQQGIGESLSAQAVELILASSVGREREQALRSYQLYIDEPDLRQVLRAESELAPSIFEARLVVHVERDECLLVVGDWDQTPKFRDPPSDDSLTVFALARRERAVTEQERSAMPWSLNDHNVMVAGGEPVPQEFWMDLDYGRVLEHSCEKLS